MKKLMIAVAAAAMFGGAFAECQEDADCVFAYKLAISGKTTVPLAKAGNASKCIEGACYRKQGSFKFVGYIWGQTEDQSDPEQCIEGCGCNDFGSFNTTVWNNKNKYQVSGDFTFEQLDLIGTDAKKAEAVAKFNDLVLAGFGTYDVKKLRLKALSGNFAGTLPAPQCEECTYDKETCETSCESTDSAVFAVCTLEKTDAATTPAYGNWSLKYDAAAVKKLTKNFDETAITPKGFVPAN